MPVNALHDQVAKLVADHGAAAVSTAVAAHAGVTPGSKAAGAYITSIITGDQAFDEGVLHQVSNVLATGAKASVKS